MPAIISPGWGWRCVLRNRPINGRLEKEIHYYSQPKPGGQGQCADSLPFLKLFTSKSKVHCRRPGTGIDRVRFLTNTELDLY